MSRKQNTFKNVTYDVSSLGGRLSFRVIHDDGSDDPFFKEYVKHLRNAPHNTQKAYTRHVSKFIDYLIEVSWWELENGSGYFDGTILSDAINQFPEYLALTVDSEEPRIAAVAQRLGATIQGESSQKQAIAALNVYLTLSGKYNRQFRELNVQKSMGIPLFSEEDLFPAFSQREDIPEPQRLKMMSKSMLGGVMCGGPKLRDAILLKVCPNANPNNTEAEDVGVIIVNENSQDSCEDDDEEDLFEYGKDFPYEHAIELIGNGFVSYRDKALFSLIGASGSRLHEALLTCLGDIDYKNQEVYLRDPRIKGVAGFGSLYSRQQILRFPWKGRTTKLTLLIEPWASLFWENLELYFKYERLKVANHKLIFQRHKGGNPGLPLFDISQNFANIRQAIGLACERIKVPSKSPHSLRHGYGVYCKNYFPLEDGGYGLPLETVKELMGHKLVESTEKYAITDLALLKLRQKLYRTQLDGFAVQTRKEIRVEILKKELERLEREVELDKTEQKKLLTEIGFVVGEDETDAS